MRFDRKTFFDGYKREFGRLPQSHVDNLNFLLDKFEASEWFSADVRRPAFALGNMYIETYIPKTNSRFAPVRESGGKAYFIRRYWTNVRIRKQLGNESEYDAWARCGRGYIQETGLGNDKKFTDLLGIDLVSNPDEALNPDTAFRIMEAGIRHGVFTGKKVTDYINAQKTDYKGGRRVINGQDRAAEIADHCEDFEKILSRSAAVAVSPDLKTPPVIEENSAGTSPDLQAGSSDINNAPSPTVFVEKEAKPPGFFAGIKMRLAGYWATVGGLEGAKQAADNAQFLGLTAETWRTLTYVALALGAIALIVYSAYWLWKYHIAPKLLTNALLKANANTSDATTVNLASSDQIAELEKLGYLVVRRK